MVGPPPSAGGGSTPASAGADPAAPPVRGEPPVPGDPPVLTLPPEPLGLVLPPVPGAPPVSSSPPVPVVPGLSGIAPLEQPRARTANRTSAPRALGIPVVAGTTPVLSALL